MKVSRTSRRFSPSAAVLTAAACALLCLPAFAQRGGAHSAPAPPPPQYHSQSNASRPPVVRGQQPAHGTNQPQQFHSDANQPAFRAGPPIYRNGQPANGERGNGQRAATGPPGHLNQWMEQHRNLTPQQQQQALEREPGFKQLPPQQQARVRARLDQLNAMPPDQRQRVLDRVESMERLTPTQRQQVTSTMGQLHSLPPDRQRAVAFAFRNLRQLPPDQRPAAAEAYSRNLSPQERDTLNNLLRTEPYLPVKRPPAYTAAPIQ